jgi:hypothetical protein
MRDSYNGHLASLILGDLALSEWPKVV